MRARFHSWWQYIRKHWLVAIIIVFVVLMTLIFTGYRFDWTGFNGYIQVTTAHTISGPSAGTVVRTEVSQPGKALWDWLQLLIIPAVLVVGGFLLNNSTSRTEREIALDKQREDALQAYIDSMSELLLEKKLRESQPDDEVRTIARVRTLTVLPRLDKNRKASVLQFLHESRLIDKDKHIIVLEGADLSKADLRGANLRGADLSAADLRNAKLSAACLFRANLTGATDITIEELEKAKSLKGATMPDGSKHP